MSDLGSTDWSETDASNNAAVPNGWPEGMDPSGVNNAARASMGALKRWWDRVNRTKTTAGTSTALTVTYDVAHAAYYEGEVYSFTLHTALGSAATVNVNSLGARTLRTWASNGWSAVIASEYVSGQTVVAAYNSAASAFDVVGGNVPAILRSGITFNGSVGIGTPVQNYLSAAVSLVSAAVYYNGPNTGAIGRAGEIWEVGAIAAVTDTVSAAAFQAQIHDGSTVRGTGAATLAYATAGDTIPIICFCTLSAATTFTLRVRDNSGTNGSLVSSNDGGSTNLATYIFARRIS